MDKPTKKCVIHKERCIYEERKKDTPLKGIEKMLRDGGWLYFQALQKARDYFDKEWAPLKYELSERCRCLQ